MIRILAFAAAVAVAASPALAQPRDFASWLVDLRQEARANGISDAVLDRALTGVEPLPRVIELDRKQPEFTLTFQQYLDRTVTPSRVERGRRLLAEHGPLLERISHRYGVQPRFIVALWGMETDYGRVTGNFKVINALATLAWDGRRSAFFRKELMDALSILEAGDIAAEAMIGSWAGAMGQCQFMPSSYVRFSHDGDGDGRRDIWGTLPDVFASTANYLANHGWNKDYTWGRPVALPAGFDPALLGPDTAKLLQEWQRLGVRQPDGQPLPTAAITASIVKPEPDSDAAFLVYDNWRAVMKWNRSTYYALAVGHLADRIASR